MKLIITLVLNALALGITDYLLPGINVADYRTLILAAILLGLINTFIRPILMFLTAPLNFLSLGLFTFVVNALMLSMTSWILKDKFFIESFWWAVLAAAVLSVISTALSTLLHDLAKK